MAKYKTDHEDIFFNLFDVLRVHENNTSLEQSDIRSIIEEQDKFAENEIYPARTVGDHEGVSLTDKGVQAPESFRAPTKGFYENGWFALGLPEDIGGMPVPHAVSFAANSLITGANVAWSMYPGLSKAALNVLRLKGSELIQKTCIPPMMEGRWGGTMCLTEPGAGSDVGASKTTAKKIQGDTYAITGTKIFISSGDNDLYENIIHLVLARTPDAPAGTKGLSLFVVPKIRYNDQSELEEANHVRCSKVEEKMGIHGSATCELQFGDGGECHGTLIGKEGEGMATMFIMMNEARLMCGVQGEAQAHLAYELTKQYCQERSQFGKSIADLPDVNVTLLKMRARTRALRALILYIADCFDRAEQDESFAELVNLMTPVCKTIGSEEGFHVSVDAIQLHGGYGYCTEYGIEQFARDTKIATIYEGTNAIQGMDFVTRKILKDKGRAFSFVLKQMGQDIEKMNGELQSTRKYLAEATTLMGQAASTLGELAQKDDITQVLNYCTSFQQACSYAFAAWRLSVNAVVAEKTGGDFARERVQDAEVYTQLLLRPQLETLRMIAQNSLSVA